MSRLNGIGLGTAPEGSSSDTDNHATTPDTLSAHTHTAPDTAPPLKPFSKKGTHMPTQPTKPVTQPKPNAANSFRTEIPRRVLDIPGAQRSHGAPGDSVSNENKLVVGKEIKLSGAISACECLVVEGEVSAELAEARDLYVSRGGVFKGTATVERAEISGLFDGDLTAVDTAVIKPGGVIKGNVTYVNIIMEKGAIVEGTLKPISRQTAPMKAKLAAPRPAPTTPATSE